MTQEGIQDNLFIQCATGIMKTYIQNGLRRLELLSLCLISIHTSLMLLKTTFL